MKGVIYYTNNKLDELKADWMLDGLVKDSIKASRLPIVSVSQKPIDFGENFVLPLKSSPVSMVEQIIVALLASKADYVFFCEHDVIYHPSHFEFTPPTDDTFYYNTNVWRCHPRRNICVTYDGMRSLSGMCANRELALIHFIKRLNHIFKKGYHKEISRNPRWARVMGYEPGKSPRNGGFSNDKLDEWKSELPNLDIRHRLTMTIPKLSKDQFNHPPENWQEVTVDKVPGWDIKQMFKL